MKFSRQTKFLLMCSSLLIVAFLVSGYYNLTPLMATDSGFDASYGGSGGGYSGSSDSGDIFWIIYFIVQYPILSCIIIIVFIIYILGEMSRKRKADGSNCDAIKNSYNDDATKELLLTAYQMFYDTQKAWMNFDYDRLKSLVTDELYNSYYNQLQTLELKGQKNIMRDFVVTNSQLLSHKQEGDKITVVVSLNVSFYDYIVDTSNKVIRGSDTRKVTMFYHLTFVASLGSNDKCPNCGAPLETPSYCDYCKSHIQGLSTGMRLSKKEAIKQK